VRKSAARFPQVIDTHTKQRKRNTVMKTHILVVDGDPFMAKMLAFVLADSGYQTTTLSDPGAVIRFLADHNVSLILLDVILPHTDGLTLCTTIQSKHPDIPIIFLSAHGHLNDKVAGFDRGADDYIVKPFEPMELLARVRAVLRRHQRADRNVLGMAIKVGYATLDLQELRFAAPGQESVALTVTEMKVLECLMRNANAVLSREALIERVWGYNFDGCDNRTNVYIRRLRGKIEADPEEPRYIQTVRGFGYTFRDRRSAARATNGAVAGEGDD
jgi:DNA-binding response OmpR family regulator